MTNEEKIKAMSTEELANFIENLDSCACCTMLGMLGRPDDMVLCEATEHDCNIGIARWLKQEAEE